MRLGAGLSVTKFLIFGLSILLAFASFPAMGGICGRGKIVSVIEGGWDTNDFMIKIDYSEAQSAHPETEHKGWIVYKSTLDQQRLNGIRAMALTAYVSEREVTPFSHNGNCSDATELMLR